MEKLLEAPLDPELILKKKRSLKRELLKSVPVSSSRTVRIAILGGSTTTLVRDMLELFLLKRGIRPSFYESEYNKWYEDGAFGNEEFDAFRPEIAVIYTSVVNLDLPEGNEPAADLETRVGQEIQRYRRVWSHLSETYHCMIIQNNFDEPIIRNYGSFDCVHPTGTVSFVQRMNEKFAAEAAGNRALVIHDLHYLCARIGLDQWYDQNFYYLYKSATTFSSVPLIGESLAALVQAILGMSRKCLVLDLDNTLWGGVVSEDGVDGLVLGHETALGEAFLAWQKYILRLKARGVILAVCSKNDEDIAKSGFTHPDSLLKVDDFAAFVTNWEPKSANIVRLAGELNIGTDSLVFIDDNPAEREIVRRQVPEVAVPEVVGGEPSSYIAAVEDGHYFETISLSEDDLSRNASYRANRERHALEITSGSYDEYLQSLAMTAEIAPFRDVYLERIAQLTNKSNQFNLTTRRYTQEEITEIAEDPRYLTLYGRLADIFGDNGLVSVIIGEKEESRLHIRLWLMSCRVLKRGMEFAMLDALAERAREAGMTELIGYYFPTKKNAMVKDLYRTFGFALVSESEEGSTWKLSLEEPYAKRSRFIEVKGE